MTTDAGNDADRILLPVLYKNNKDNEDDEDKKAKSKNVKKENGSTDFVAAGLLVAVLLLVFMFTGKGRNIL